MAPVMVVTQPDGDLGRRALSSASWNLLSSGARITVLMLRSVLLARWLPVATFGVYGLAHAITDTVAMLAAFGLTAALLHRCQETENEDAAAATHFALSTAFTVAWVTLLLVGAPLVTAGERRTALLVVVVAVALQRLTMTPVALLIRRVRHRRLAALDLVGALLSTGVALSLASRGATLWALLSVDLTTSLVSITGLWLWRPIWRPRVAWDRTRIAYFLRFGRTALAGDALAGALARLDRLWTGLVLGDAQLGFYSRAMAFASYPQRFLSQPVNMVAGGSYAELKNDPRRLSEAFFRVNAVLLRGGFLLAGALALTAPELIPLLIGDRWLPMLPIFRVMLVYALLDPIKVTIAQLFIAVGQPAIIARARLVQLGILLVGLVSAGTLLGVTGVALTVSAMQLSGMAILLLRARRFVTFSAVRLLLPPVAVLPVALATAAGMAELLPSGSALWVSAGVKSASFAATFTGLLLAIEYRSLLRMLALVRESWHARGSRSSMSTGVIAPGSDHSHPTSEEGS